MRFARFKLDTDTPYMGWIHEDSIGGIEGDLFSDYRRLEAETPLSSVKLLAPVNPSKIICVSRNFPDHVKEQGNDIPEIPVLFLKPPSAIIGTNEDIIIPPQSTQIEHEAELAVVIKKMGRWIPSEEAMEFVLGFTIANDVTARDLQYREEQWTRAKGFDTFCPLGPWIETDFEPSDSLITCHVNGDLRQMGSTREMIFTVPQLIAYASSIMTLLPGDILLTGTPAGVGPLTPGDVIEISIEGIGTLRNQVKASQSFLK